MNTKRKNLPENIALGGIIAGAYIALTLAFSPISFGAVQFRISEILTVLPLFTFSAIPGLTAGCFIANIISSPLPLDGIFRTAATLFACILTRLCRNIRFRDIPLLSMIFPTVINGIVIGLEIAFSMTGRGNGSFFISFITSCGWIMLGEAVSSFLPGALLYKPLKKTKIFRDEK